MSGDDWLGNEQPKSKVCYIYNSLMDIYVISIISQKENQKEQLM